jgi:hypothetical protein
LYPLIRSFSRVTTALANFSLVFELFSFLMDCSVTFSKGFGLVAFFANVKDSSDSIHLSCLVCIQSASVTSQVLCYWPKKNVSVCEVSTICWIFLKFWITWLQHLFLIDVQYMGLHYGSQGSYLMTDVMPVPAKSLMQSAQHVTA